MAQHFRQDDRKSTIESIRIRIENGTYQIDASDLADAILRSMREQKMAGDKGQAA